MPAHAPEAHPWDATLNYQLYPRSFKDSGIGVPGEGDIPGIIQNLDYLQDIGVGSIWLSPTYPSPWKDGGYDVSDYENVNPRFGTLKDADDLIEGAHARDIRVMFDIVPNHTSDQHPWFLEESNRPPGDPRDDLYIWRDGREDGPPNNWLSVFSRPNHELWQQGKLQLDKHGLVPGVPAWEWSPTRGQWYLRTFAKEQPDLNWGTNPKVAEKIGSAMRFWLERGVDGFRIDAFDRTGKNPSLADEEPNLDYDNDQGNPYFRQINRNSSGYLDTLLGNLEAITSVAAEYPDMYMLVETTIQDPAVLRRINSLRPRNMGTFNFGMLDTPPDVQSQRRQIRQYYGNQAKGALAGQTTGNHDRGREATRRGAAGARAATVVARTLPGMVTVFQGDELGLTDIEVLPEKSDDPHDRRDASRGPIPHNDSKYGGFSEHEPWLPEHPDYRRNNIASQQADPTSPLSLFKKLSEIARRPEHQRGAYADLALDDPRLLAHTRTADGKQMTIIVNGSTETVRTRPLAASDLLRSTGSVLLSSTMDRQRYGRYVHFEDGVVVGPEEALVIEQTA